MKKFELQYDDNCTIFLEGEQEDDSFDHEFGTEEKSHFEIKEFTVLVWIRGSEFDITSSIPEKRLNIMKEWALSEILED